MKTIPPSKAGYSSSSPSRGQTIPAHSTHPLASLFVLDMTVNTPGPFCSMTLSDLGARVVKVEPPGGDPLRKSNPQMFAALNRGKESLSLDLKTRAAREILWLLAQRADVMLEGSRPGAAQRLGADYETISSRNPNIIYCSISGFGQEGPWRDRPGHDINYLALSGYMSLQTAVEGRPWPPAVLISDVASGMYAAIAVLAAVNARADSPGPAYIDLSMTDSALTIAGIEMSRASTAEAARPPNVAFIPTYGLFACADRRWISLGIVHEDHFWRRFCDVAEMEDLAALTFQQRLEKSKEIESRLESAFASRPAIEWEHRLLDADVPVAAVRSLDELPDLPHFSARGSFFDIGAHRFVSPPMKFSSRSVGRTAPPPDIDEQRDAILSEIGYTA